MGGSVPLRAGGGGVAGWLVRVRGAARQAASPGMAQVVSFCSGWTEKWLRLVNGKWITAIPWRGAGLGEGLPGYRVAGQAPESAGLDELSLSRRKEYENKCLSH